MQRTLTITWRDESYGALSGVAAAFRLYDTADFSDDEVQSIHDAARAAGFEWHAGRCSFVAYDAGAADTLGYIVEHAGRWSALPSGVEA